jgi:NAD(P) transhydrogenase subunit alpha
VVKEAAAGERRVALTPEVVVKLAGADIHVLVEAGAGAAAWSTDQQYEAAGALVVNRARLYADADVLVSLGPVEIGLVRPGQALIGLWQPMLHAPLMAELAGRSVTVVSLDALPRTLSRAQGMDALSSQSSAAGYKAVLVAAESFDRFFPMLMTAAGTSKPAEVLVLGAGVAGLQAIGTAKRLGAIVRAYDVRAASREEVISVGGKFIDLASVAGLASDGGYARELTADEQAAQQAELAGHIAKHDIVITTAQVPGRRPPLMVRAGTVARMRPGSVIVDLAASELGGNVEGSEPGRTLVTDNGVTVVGAHDLPSQLAASASASYARNISATLHHLSADGALVLDLADEITGAIVITHDGEIVHAATAAELKENAV